MERLRCQKCYRSILDIESQKFRIRIRCRYCKCWCSFESRDSSADAQEPKSVISNAELR